MKILYLPDLGGKSDDAKVTFLTEHNQDVVVQALPNTGFDEALRTAQQKFDEQKPDVVVGYAYGAAVAMNMATDKAKLVLLCPAWKNHGPVKTINDNATIIHAYHDEVVPLSDSKELVEKSSVARSALITAGANHLLEDDRALQILLEVILSPDSEVNKGLISYYSSLANAALAQFDTISFLLGETTDWTAPGTACELLIRQLVQKVLPSRYSVDKGFIHGRRVDGNKTVHSPEIDVLIHDTESYAPLLRMDDFVIVQPAAVRGVVQVKRTLTSATLKKGIANIIDAKRHIRDCIGSSARSHPIDDVFSAFVAFRDDVEDKVDGGISKTYENRITESFKEFTDGYIAPHFVGSLSRRVFGFSGLNLQKMSYTAYQCSHPSGDGRSQVNFGIQIFLLMLTRAILPMGMRPPFAFAPDYRGSDYFIVFEKGDGDAGSS